MKKLILILFLMPLISKAQQTFTLNGISLGQSVLDVAQKYNIQQNSKEPENGKMFYALPHIKKVIFDDVIVTDFSLRAKATNQIDLIGVRLQKPEFEKLLMHLIQKYGAPKLTDDKYAWSVDHLKIETLTLPKGDVFVSFEDI